MKFENPIINISMFDVENIVTVSTAVEQAQTNAKEAVTAALQAKGIDSPQVTSVLEFVF